VPEDDPPKKKPTKMAIGISIVGSKNNLANQMFCKLVWIASIIFLHLVTGILFSL
jgi:hypothetical protein